MGNSSCFLFFSAEEWPFVSQLSQKQNITQDKLCNNFDITDLENVMNSEWFVVEILILMLIQRIYDINGYNMKDL